MRSLTEVFAPGAPTLPEGLRTLVVSPDRELEPGMTVRASFAFTNQGGATASGVRVRFNLPDGLVYLVGSGTLDGGNLDDDLGNSPLLARTGAAIGDVPPGEQRRIEIAYSVAGAIENGSTVELQAAVASFEVAPVGSNVVRLIARSKPLLENALTTVALEVPREARPGGEAQVTVRLHNAGESSAHDVVVIAPIPQHTVYVANSARMNGREIERDLGSAFDHIHAPVVAATLAASATGTLSYKVRIEDPLPDAAQLVATARVASQETAGFDLAPAALTVVSSADFTDDRSTCTLEPATDVFAGSLVSLTLVATNAGSATAEDVTVTIDFADGLLPVRGSLRIDGKPLRERKKESMVFELGHVGARESVEVRMDAIVASPIADGTTLASIATIHWAAKRERRFERSVTVHSVPAFSPRKNVLSRSASAIVAPGDDIEATLILVNDGSADATDCVVRVARDSGLDDVRIYEKATRLQQDDDSVELGTIEAYGTRRLTIRGRVRSPHANRTELQISASLHTHELGEIGLGDVRWLVHSQPAFTAQNSHLTLVDDAVLRPNGIASVDVVVTNEGTDIAHDVRMRLYVSPDARLEIVDGATRDRSSLLFGEIAPGARAQARLGLRLLRSLAKAYPVTVDGVISANAAEPLPLERLTIATAAEPDFSIGTFRSEPADSADAGEMVEWALHVRNGGDGPARRVQIRIDVNESTIYVPNSTTVNDVPLRDTGAQAPFALDRGITLSDVDPGVEVTIRWRDVIHNGLTAGIGITRVATITYDGDRRDELFSSELKVRATPVFANTIPGLPFGVDGMVGPSFVATRALTESRYLELPPATPVENGTRDGARRVVGASPMLSLNGVDAEEVQADSIVLQLALSHERAERTMRMLDELDLGMLVGHLFVIRALLPDQAGDAHSVALGAARGALRDHLDRIYIRLRLPNFTMTVRDIDSASLRGAVERALLDVVHARGTPSAPHDQVVLLRTVIEREELIAAIDALHDAPSAAMWSALAHLLPNDSPEAANYRATLIAALQSCASSDASEFADLLVAQPAPAASAAFSVLRARLGLLAAS
ncbi:MAG: COG1361 family protein [Vulcanimicrobiaceae bacterium]